MNDVIQTMAVEDLIERLKQYPSKANVYIEHSLYCSPGHYKIIGVDPSFEGKDKDKVCIIKIYEKTKSEIENTK